VIGAYPEKNQRGPGPGPRSPGRHICIGRQKTPEKGNFELAFSQQESMLLSKREKESQKHEHFTPK
jgi:hypothetical protein